jgi:hypothetical protein
MPPDLTERPRMDSCAQSAAGSTRVLGALHVAVSVAQLLSDRVKASLPVRVSQWCQQHVENDPVSLIAFVDSAISLQSIFSSADPKCAQISNSESSTLFEPFG